MKHVRIIALALAIACISAIAFRSAVIARVIPWSVGDGHGHGPDYGTAEWSGALTGQATRAAMGVGLVLFIATVGAGYVYRNKNA